LRVLPLASGCDGDGGEEDGGVALSLGAIELGVEGVAGVAGVADVSGVGVLGAALVALESGDMPEEGESVESCFAQPPRSVTAAIPATMAIRVMTILL